MLGKSACKLDSLIIITFWLAISFHFQPIFFNPLITEMDGRHFVHELKTVAAELAHHIKKMQPINWLREGSTCTRLKMLLQHTRQPSLQVFCDWECLDTGWLLVSHFTTGGLMTVITILHGSTHGSDFLYEVVMLEAQIRIRACMYTSLVEMEL